MKCSHCVGSMPITLGRRALMEVAFLKAYYFIVDSVTSAMRANDILNRMGIQSKIVRTPRKFSNKGCGFSVVVFSSIENARAILNKNGVRILSVQEN